MLTITIANLKGGVGKTTTATGLAGAAAAAGFDTLVLDLDGQSSLTDQLLPVGEDLENLIGLADLFIEYGQSGGEEYGTLESVARPVGNEQHEGALDLIPTGGWVQMHEAEDLLNDEREAWAMYDMLSPLYETGEYDLAVIDTPPSENALWFNAITAADMVVAPVLLRHSSIIGIKHLQMALEAAHAFSDQDEPAPCFYLPTNHDKRIGEPGGILETLNERVGIFPEGQILTPPIRYCSNLSKATGAKQTIFGYDASSRSAKDYMSLFKNVFVEGPEGFQIAPKAVPA